MASFECIGAVEFWMGRLMLDRRFEIDELQKEVNEHVKDTGFAVVAYYVDEPASLTLLHWPETREGYKSTSVDEESASLRMLAQKLEAGEVSDDVLTPRTIHCMMGRKIGGYDDGDIAPMEDLLHTDLDGFEVTEGHMISARVYNGNIEPYGEPVGIIITDVEHEAVIHEIGDKLQQHHYVIEHAPHHDKPGHTELFETPWANI